MSRAAVYSTGDLNNNLVLGTLVIDGTAAINPKYLIESIELRISLHKFAEKKFVKFCTELAMHK